MTTRARARTVPAASNRRGKPESRGKHGPADLMAGRVLEIRQLRSFIQICQEGSFSKAAAALGIAQPVLSRQIKMLEADLGVTLFYRHGRGANPTAEGLRLLASASEIMVGLARLREEVTEERGVPRGKVTLALPPFLATVLAVPLMQHISQHYPHVSLHILDGFSGYLHEWLLEGRVDIAVLNEASRSRAISVEPLMSIGLLLVGKPTSAWNKMVGSGPSISARRIGGVPLIIAEKPHGIRRVVEQLFSKLGTEIQVAYSIDSLAAQKELIAAGLGVGILPYSSVKLELETGRLCASAIVKPRIHQDCVLVTSAERPVTLAMRTIINFIRSHAEALYESDLPEAWRRAALS